MVIGKIMDDSYDSALDTSACQPGMATRFVTNYMPELHEEGKDGFCVALFKYF